MGASIQIFALLLALMLSACSQQGRPVHLIVEDDFKGEIVLRPEPSAPEITLVNGHFEISVPASGNASFKDLAPLRKWHSLIVKRQSGKVIPLAETVDHGTIALRGGRTNSEGITRYFIGSLRDYYKHRGWTRRVAELERTEQGSAGQPEKRRVSIDSSD